MTDIPSSLIGHITDVHGSGLTASLIEIDQEGTFTVTIGDEDILVGQIGSYVAVLQGQIQTLSMITRMTAQLRLVPSDPVDKSG